MSSFPNKFSLLKELSETPGVSGREELIRALVKKELQGIAIVDDVTVDSMGNVIGTVSGTDAIPRVVAIDAHIDEIGFIVKSMDANGFLRFIARGGFDPKTVVSQTVTLYDSKGNTSAGIIGSKAIHLMSADERKRNAALTDFFIDTGRDAEFVRGNFPPGTPAAMDRKLMMVGDLICGKALDNRVSVFAVLEALKRIERPAATLQIVFSCQEEVGLRGAQGYAGGNAPDMALVIDVTHGCKIPGIADTDRVTTLGEGVAIGVQDGSCIFHPRLVEGLQDIATAESIDFQIQVKDKGGTNGGALQRYGGAVATCALGIPLRYMHSVVETIHPDDVESAISLLAAFMTKAHEIDYSLA